MLMVFIEVIFSNNHNLLIIWQLKFVFFLQANSKLILLLLFEVD